MYCTCCSSASLFVLYYISVLRTYVVLMLVEVEALCTGTCVRFVLEYSLHVRSEIVAAFACQMSEADRQHHTMTAADMAQIRMV